MGGAERRPFILRLAAQSAARQTEVRYPLRFFCICFACEKNFCYNKNVLNLASHLF